MKVKCPECEYMVWVDPCDDVGDKIFCEGCDATLEIIKLDPVKVRLTDKDLTDENIDEYDENEEEEEEMLWDE